MALQARVRKWGNSMGIVFPKEFVEENDLKINQKVLVSVVKEADLSGIYGTLKPKRTAQEFKDLAREGWN